MLMKIKINNEISEIKAASEEIPSDNITEHRIICKGIINSIQE